MIFAAYVKSFYGPGQIYGSYFDNNLTDLEIGWAIGTHLATPGIDFCGDTVDRETVRDIMLARRKEAK